MALSLGSDFSVLGTEPWIASEVEYLRQCRAAGTPIFGICFGGQILAAALGGSVQKAEHPDVGWRELASNDTELIPGGPWLCWHEDVFVPPPGSFEIARDQLGSLAFRDGADVGLQFHPEVDEALVESWIEGSTERLLGNEVDVDQLREESRRAAAGAEAMAFDLFDRVARLWSAA